MEDEIVCTEYWLQDHARFPRVWKLLQAGNWRNYARQIPRVGYTIGQSLRTLLEARYQPLHLRQKHLVGGGVEASLNLSSSGKARTWNHEPGISNVSRSDPEQE